MNLSQTGVFDLAEQRLQWLDRRQEVLAQNIANADTPGYQPKDLTPFATVLQDSVTAPVRTDPMHLSGTQGGMLQGAAVTTTERAPDGNAVTLSGQLVKVADTETSQQLVTNLYQKYLSLFRTALGASG
jgi:flagellar basal-body rod protein FlgB